MCIYLGVLPKGRMEALKFYKRLLIKSDKDIPLRRRIEIEVIDSVSDTSDTVDSANALHKASSVPRRIVADDHICPMKINALGQYVSADEYLVVVLLLARIVG